MNCASFVSSTIFRLFSAKLRIQISDQWILMSKSKEVLFFWRHDQRNGTALLLSCLLINTSLFIVF